MSSSSSSFPRMNVKSPQTFGSMTNSGVLATAEQTNLPLLNSHFRGSSGPGSFPTSNDNHLHQNVKKNFEFLLGGLTNEAQMKYSEGDLMFFKDARENTPSEGYAAYALPNLNYALEVAQQNSLMKKGLAALDDVATIDPGVTSRKRKAKLGDNLDSFPLNTSEFVSSMAFMGVIHSTIEKRGVRKRNVAITMEGRIKMCNLWHGARVGDRVGLCVKKVRCNRYALVNELGENAGRPTDGDVLQVRACFEPNEKSPINCSSFGAPKANDLDYWDHNASIAMASLGLDRTYQSNSMPEYPLLRWDQALTPRVSHNISYSSYEQGLYIPLGIVQFVDKEPSENLIELAHRSFRHYRQLFNEATIDIVLEAHNLSQLSTL